MDCGRGRQGRHGVGWGGVAEMQGAESEWAFVTRAILCPKWAHNGMKSYTRHTGGRKRFRTRCDQHSVFFLFVFFVFSFFYKHWNILKSILMSSDWPLTQELTGYYVHTLQRQRDFAAKFQMQPFHWLNQGMARQEQWKSAKVRG